MSRAPTSQTARSLRYEVCSPRIRAGFDRIGLGTLAKRSRKSTHLRRIDNNNRQTAPAIVAATTCSKPPVCFNANRNSGYRPESFYQLIQTVGITRDYKCLDARPDVHIKLVFGNIYPDKTSVHRFPSLQNRASRAALATVRVRWNGGR